MEMEMKKKFISWRRVSTKKQGRSGLGLEAQKQMIDYFVGQENGNLIADYEEVYTGTELNGCTELRKAIEHCKKENAILMIAKTDRFRNTIEALQIYEEMGDGKIYFCDLPHTDKFTLTLFFALAEREALIVSIRTKAALDAKKARGETWTRNTNPKEAVQASIDARIKRAKQNQNNIFLQRYIENYEQRYGKLHSKVPNEQWDLLVKELNTLGAKTASGLEFNRNRLRSMVAKLKKEI